MDLGLTGKTAIITGASKGIGKAIAEVLAEEGCVLHLVSRTEADLNAVRDNLSSRFDAQATVHALDLSKPEDVQTLADATADADILINNAGAIPGGDLAKLSDDDIKEGWQLKVFGTVGLVRHFYPRMCERGDGVIINIIGMAGERGRVAYIAGSMGNAALMQMTRTIGAESMDHGVRVLGVNPGPTQRPTRKNNSEMRIAGAKPWVVFPVVAAACPKNSPPSPPSWPVRVLPGFPAPSSWSMEASTPGHRLKPEHPQ